MNENNWMVRPDSQKLNGKPVLGWAIVREALGSNDFQRVSIELYKPRNVPDGCTARPLTFADIEVAVKAVESLDRYALLTATCKRNLNMGVNQVPARFVLEQLGIL